MTSVPIYSLVSVPRQAMACTHLDADGLDNAYLIALVGPQVFREVVVCGVSIVILCLAPHGDYGLCC
jgi:hypothetical protein